MSHLPPIIQWPLIVLAYCMAAIVVVAVIELIKSNRRFR